MKIALVTETFPPEINGVAMTLSRLVHQLRRAGHRVQVVRPRQPDDREDGPDIVLPGMRIPGYQGLRFGFPSCSALRKLWQSDLPDLVHIATEGPLGWGALRVARQLNIPVTSGFHTNFQAYGHYYRYGFLRRWVVAYLRWFHNQTRATFAPTKEACEQLEAYGMVNLQVMGRGVDTELFTPEKRSAKLRHSWLGREEGTVVLYVGRIAAEKNLDLAVEAYLKMSATRQDLRMVFVGDGPLRQSLQASYPQFIFCGSLRGEALATHYASADLFIFPSLTETFGNVVTEAMASALAVVAFDYAAARQYIRSGVNGYTVAKGDAAGFCRAAQQLLLKPDRMSAARVAARQTVLPLSWAAVAARFVAELEKHRSGTQG